jgi:hypothetical protein
MVCFQVDFELSALNEFHRTDHGAFEKSVKEMGIVKRKKEEKEKGPPFVSCRSIGVLNNQDQCHHAFGEHSK